MSLVNYEHNNGIATITLNDPPERQRSARHPAETAN